MEGRQKNRKKQVDARKREGLESMGKDVLSIILRYLRLIHVKKLRLTNKHIEERTRDYYFNNSVCHISMIPFDRCIPLYVRRISIRTLCDYERAHRSNICFTYLRTFGVWEQQIPMINTPFEVPSSVIRFDMGTWFNQPIILPSNLKYFIMSLYFNHPITLPSSLTHLEMGSSFNHPIEFPPNLEYFRGPKRWEGLLPKNIKETIFW